MGQNSKLNAYIKSQNGKRFALGVHDCFTFTNGWRNFSHGQGFADDFIGKYSGLNKGDFERIMVECFGTSDLIEALNKRLQPCYNHPPRGSIVVMPSAKPDYIPMSLGISDGVKALFLGPNSIVSFKIEDTTGAWF